MNHRRHRITPQFALLIVAWLAVVAGAQAVSTNEITIKPSAPTNTGWTVSLPAYATAQLTITVVKSENGHVLKRRDTPGQANAFCDKTITSQGQNFLWTGDLFDSGATHSGTCMVLNTGSGVASSTIKVECTWGRQGGTGGGGSGGGTVGGGSGSGDILGLAIGTASRNNSPVSWQFDRTMQTADGISEIHWTVGVYDSSGMPVAVTFNSISVVPSSAPWTINPSSSVGSQTSLSGTVRSSTPSVGNLQATFTGASGSPDASGTQLAFVQIDIRETGLVTLTGCNENSGNVTFHLTNNTTAVTWQIHPQLASGARFQNGATGDSVVVVPGTIATNYTVKAYADGNTSCFDTAELRVMSVTVEKLWSDQILLVACNFLPGGSGCRCGFGGELHYILVGTRAPSDEGRVKMRVVVTNGSPDIVMFQLSTDGASAIATGEAEGDVIKFRVPGPMNDSDDYFVHVGVDQNGDNTLSSDELRVKFPYKVKFVDATTYSLADFAVRSLYLAGWAALPTAANNLKAFLDGDVPNGATEQPIAVDARDRNTPLEHPTGLHFNATSCTAITTEYIFGVNSLVADKVARSSTYRNLIMTILDLRRQDVQNWFNTNSVAEVRQFTWELNLTVDFDSGSLVDDLHFAFGKAKFTGSVSVTAIRNGSGFRYDYEHAILVGTQKDLYDWDYDIRTPDRLCAVLQAGYPSLGTAGEVKANRVNLNHQISLIP